MSQFNYTEDDKTLIKVLKKNQVDSLNMLKDKDLILTRRLADDCIESSEVKLDSLGRKVLIDKKKSSSKKAQTGIVNPSEILSWDSIVASAENCISNDVKMEDLLTEFEINESFLELEQINSKFFAKTSLCNKIDINFLSIAIALQVSKSLLFPFLAKKMKYGESFDKTNRLAHNDKTIKEAHRGANDKFRNKHLKKSDDRRGREERKKDKQWINILYQSPVYDTTKGSPNLGINMGGGYHRLYTLGHDPILGWVFGTANILTDIITLNDFSSYRVTRNPIMITPNKVDLFTLFKESYDVARANRLNLPAAVFAQAQHLKSDVFTKAGLPVPVLATFNEKLASDLYKNQYDSLCAARDSKIISSSYLVSMLIDIIITLTHRLFKTENESEKLFEVRTRKILLLSNSIASSSSVISTLVTKNLKNLDIGSMLMTLTHLFFDTRFIMKVRDEFVQQEINKKLNNELEEIDKILNSLQ